MVSDNALLCSHGCYDDASTAYRQGRELHSLSWSSVLFFMTVAVKILDIMSVDVEIFSFYAAAFESTVAL